MCALRRSCSDSGKSLWLLTEMLRRDQDPVQSALSVRKHEAVFDDVMHHMT